MIYIDSSCLLMLILVEEGSDAVSAAIAKEDTVIVSGLTELEALIELKGRFMGGEYVLAKWRHLELELQVLRNQEPFVFRPVPNGVWDVAFRQHRNSRDVHCRTLDRLHLAAAEKFGLTRIMTRDGAQAKAAEALGFKVIQPGSK
jgi:predicted nucleic acid-binding protein